MGSKPLDGSTSLSPTPKDVVQEALSFGVEATLSKQWPKPTCLLPWKRSSVKKGFSVTLKQAAILVPD
jgi:hypothetical protein